MNKHLLAAAGSYLLWGVLIIYWKQLSAVDSVYTLCSRIFWAEVSIFLILIFTHKLDKVKSILKDKKLFWTLTLAGVAMSFNWGGTIWCAGNEHILDASLAGFISPLLSILVGGLFYKEKLTKLHWIAFAIAVFGIGYQIVFSGYIPYMSFVISLSFIVYSVIKKGIALESDVSIFVETLIVAPLALIFLVYSELNGTGAFTSGALDGWRNILLPLAGIVTFMPLALYSYGIQKIPLSLAGILLFITPTLQFLIGAVLYSEAITQPQAVTFICVWIAIIMFLGKDAYDRKKQKQLT